MQCAQRDFSKHYVILIPNLKIDWALATKCHACLEDPYSITGLSHMAATTLLDAKLVILATVIIFMESKRK